MARRANRTSSFLLLAGGLLIWAIHFGLMYGTQTAYCVLAHQPADATPLRVLGVALTAVAVAALIWLGLSLHPARYGASDRQIENEARSFVSEAAIGVVLIALLGVLWSFIPLMLLPACAMPA